VKLLGQNVGVWDEIELLATESLLHFHIVVAQSILPSDLVALRKVIDSLKLVEALVEVALAAGGGPEDVPLVTVRIVEVVLLENAANELRVALQQLVQHLLVLNVIAAARALSRHWRVQQLLLRYSVDVLNLIDRLHWGRVQVLRKIHH